MYKIVVLVFCFVQYVFCTNCSLFGAEVPPSACDNSLCQPITTEQLLQFKNYKVLATTWNTARAIFVSASCTSIYSFIEPVNTGKKLETVMTVTVNHGVDCDSTLYFPSNLTAKAEGYGEPVWKTFKLIEPDSTWEICFPYINGGDYIYRRCQVFPVLPPGKAIAVIDVYEEAGGPTRKPDIMAAKEKLGAVNWAETTVDCY